MNTFNFTYSFLLFKMRLLDNLRLCLWLALDFYWVVLRYSIGGKWYPRSSREVGGPLVSQQTVPEHTLWVRGESRSHRP